MTTIYSNNSLDMQSTLFPGIGANIANGELHKNIQLEWNKNPKITDQFTLTYLVDGKHYTTGFYGNNLSLDFLTNPKTPAGEIVFIMTNITDNGQPNPTTLVVTDTSLNFSSLYNAIISNTNDDDKSLLLTSLSRNDVIQATGNLLGGSGLDRFTINSGIATIDGGDSIDTVQINDLYSSYNITGLQDGSYVIQSPSTKLSLRNVELVEFQDESFRLQSNTITNSKPMPFISNGHILDISSPLLTGLAEGFISDKFSNPSSANNDKTYTHYTISWKDSAYIHTAEMNGENLFISTTGEASGYITSLWESMKTIDGSYPDNGLIFANVRIPFQQFRSAILSNDSSDDTNMMLSALNLGGSFIGGPSGDNLIGGMGNDIFIPKEGNDTINGGAGIDILIINDNKADVSLATNFLGQVKIDSIHDGSDIISNVERMWFVDTFVALDINGNAGEAYRIYEAAFNRNPDAGGLGYWIYQLDKGATLKSVAEGFLASAEFQKLYGSSPSNQSFVDNLYKNILDRAGEKDGVDFWIGKLNNGTSRADVLVGFSESAENKAGVIGSIQNGIEYKEWLG